MPQKNIFADGSFFKIPGNILQHWRREVTRGALRSVYGRAPGSGTEGFVPQLRRVSRLLLSCETRRCNDGAPPVFALSCQASLCKSIPRRSRSVTLSYLPFTWCYALVCLAFAIQITGYRKERFYSGCFLVQIINLDGEGIK